MTALRRDLLIISASALGTVAVVALLIAPSLSTIAMVSFFLALCSLFAGLRAEHEPKRTPLDLASVLDVVPDVIMILDTDGRCLKVVSPGSEPASSTTAAEILSSQPFTLLNAIGQALRERSAVTFDQALPGEKTKRWFSITVSPLGTKRVLCAARDVSFDRDAEQTLRGYQKELEDRVQERTDDLSRVIADLEGEISGHQNSLSILRATQRQLSLAQEISQVGSFEWDKAAGTMTWSDEFFQIHGFAPQSVAPSFDTLMATVHPTEREAIRAAITAAMKDGRGFSLICQLLLGQVEKTVHYRCEVSNERETTGFRLIGTVQDLTEWRRAESEIRAGRERLALVARATNDAVWDWNLAENSRWWGEAVEDLFGYRQLEIGHDQQSWTSRIHPDDHDRVVRGLGEAIRAEHRVWTEEYQFRRADGSYANVYDHGYIICDDEGKPIRMIGAMLDITERKLLERQLERAQRVSSLGRVAASMAHEFNNVLMGMQPFVELMRRRGSDAALRTSATETLAKCIARGKRATEEILGFTRPIEPKCAPVHVASYLLGMNDELAACLGSDIQVNIDISESDVYIQADVERISQVFMNLALNARDAMPKGGELTITAHRGDSKLFRLGSVPHASRFHHFVVRDNGSGVEPEKLGRLFEPMFTTKANGHGLGLAVCHQIVTAHGGYIFVDSTVGVGTTFHLFLPLQEDVAPFLEGNAKPPSIAGTRILVVEDEPIVADGLAALLDQEEAIVRVARLGGEALPLAREFEPDLVILDIGLPDMDGTDVFALLRQWQADVPVIFSSGHADGSRFDGCMSGSDVLSLSKPYNMDDLLHTMAKLLGSRSEAKITTDFADAVSAAS